MKKLFDDICHEIESEYLKTDEANISAEDRGYRFLLSSGRTSFRTDIPLMILDNHPGQNKLGIVYPYPSCEESCAYFDELWDGKKGRGESQLQRKMRSVLVRLKALTQYSGSLEEFARDDVLIAYANPYRKGYKKEFLKKIWNKILINIHPQLIFVFSKPIYDEIVIDFFKCHGSVEFIDRVETGIKNHCFVLNNANYNNKKYLLVCMAPQTYFNYGNENGNKKDIIDKVWMYVERFIKDIKK